MQKTCLHTMMDGHRCGCVALKGKPYCYFHARHYIHNARPSDPDYEPPIFEDSRSILLGIRELVEADLHGKIDAKRSGRMLYAYQIAASIVNRPDAMAPFALQQLEARQAEAAKAQAELRQRRNSKQEEPAQGRSLAEILGPAVGIPINFNDIPREQHNKVLVDFVETQFATPTPNSDTSAE